MAEDEALDRLYATCYRRLVAQVYAVTGNLQEAEDVTQEAFVRAVGRWKEVRAYHSPEAWLRTVALNLARSRWRRARRHAAALVRLGPPPASEPALSADHVALVTALRALPGPQREAIVLHHLAGLSVDEVAATTRAPSGTVKARLHRGRTALATRLDPTAEVLVVGDD